MYYKDNKKYYIVFPTTRVFIKTLPLIEKNNIEHRVVSMPDYLSDRCGMAIETYGNFIKPITSILDKNDIQYEIKE